MSDTIHNYFFIHNTLAHFYKSFSDYISTTVYSRFQTKLVSTYDKAVQYLNDKNRMGGREQDKPNLPALILNPSGEITTDEGSAGGLQYHRFSQLAPGLSKGLYQPIYQDENVLITPVFGRIKGEIELIMWLNSFYEYCDLRVLLLQFFNGLGRECKLEGFNSYIIIPKELYNYSYSNDITGQTYTLNWEKYGASDQLIKTINKTECVYPCVIKPLIKLNGTSDGSTKYGGTDKLADWRLIASFEFSIEIPWFLMMQTDYMAKGIDLKINFNSTYSKYLYSPPQNILLTKTNYEFDNIDSTSIVELNYPEQADISERKSIIFNTRYYLIVTEQQSLSTESFIINLPEIISDPDLLIVNTKYGVLSYGVYYEIINNGTQMQVLIKDKSYSENDIIELYIYKEI